MACSIWANVWFSANFIFDDQIATQQGITDSTLKIIYSTLEIQASWWWWSGKRGQWNWQQFLLLWWWWWWDCVDATSEDQTEGALWESHQLCLIWGFNNSNSWRLSFPFQSRKGCATSEILHPIQPFYCPLSLPINLKKEMYVSLYLYDQTSNISQRSRPSKQKNSL